MKLLKESANLRTIEITIAFRCSGLCQCKMYFIPFLRTVFVALQKCAVPIHFIYIINAVSFYYFRIHAIVIPGRKHHATLVKAK